MAVLELHGTRFNSIELHQAPRTMLYLYILVVCCGHSHVCHFMMLHAMLSLCEIYLKELGMLQCVMCAVQDGVRFDTIRLIINKIYSGPKSPMRLQPRNCQAGLACQQATFSKIQTACSFESLFGSSWILRAKKSRDSIYKTRNWR